MFRIVMTVVAGVDSVSMSNDYYTISVPPEDFMGADKLLAEARLGSIRGPLKLGALRTSDLALSVTCKVSPSPLLTI